MSPVVEPVVFRGQRYTLRHVGPLAAVWPTTPSPPVTVLSRGDMVARPLPASPEPGSPDFVSGSWTGRLGDAGDGTFVFPNTVSSDGTLWRERFDTTNHLQFLEVYDNEELDFAGVIDTVTVDQQQVTVHCSDGWFLLKKAYERDWIVTAAPRDVIDRGTRVWQPIVVDDFAYQGVPNPGSQWTSSSSVQAGPLNASAGANDNAFNPGAFFTQFPWTSPNNISTGAAASFSVSAPVPDYVGSQGLRATGFGFSIPAGSTILGIQAGIETETTMTSGGGVAAMRPQLVVAGAVTNDYPTGNQTSGQYFNWNTPGWYYLGGRADNWNEGTRFLTPAQVNASNFGVEWQFALNPSAGSMTFSVFRVQLTVWYASTTSVAMRSTGGLTLNVTSTSGNSAGVTSNAVACTSAVWSTETSVLQLPAAGAEFALNVFEDGRTVAQIEVTGSIAMLWRWDSLSGTPHAIAQLNVASSATWDLRLECDGEWIFGFINGQLVGCFRRPATVPATLTLSMYVSSAGAAAAAVVTSAILEAEVPFLLPMAGRRYSEVLDGSLAGSGQTGVAWAAFSGAGVVASGVNTAYDFANLAQNQISQYLYVQGFFGNPIPSNATVTGLEVRILKSSGGTANAVVDVGVYLINGAVGSAGISVNRAQPGFWATGTTGGTQSTYGSMTDQWGVSGGLTPSLINNGNFGVAISAENTGFAGTCSAEVWNPVEIVVYYTLPGGDAGDYVLPGDATTYPWGGLHGRYFNDLDLQADPDRLLKILAPTRSQAYSGSGTAEYFNRQDVTINNANANPPTWYPAPGASSQYFSVRWFGAIYLKLSAGDYGIAFTVDDSVRVWIGKTNWGDQIIDSWITQAAVTYSTKLTAASLAGNPGYGGAAVPRDGWYPLIIEYAQGGASAAAQFYFTPPAGHTYTDPGGTVLTGGTQVIVPATSLSPLGCVDNRYQAVSHFDLVQQTAQAFDYQAAVEPRQLESSAFPGMLAPRIREGHDTDIVLRPDRSPRQDAEGLLNYSATADATDFVASLQGNGAGFQNGTTGQLQARVFDAATVTDALFDVQGWQDFSDSSYLSLLAGLLGSQLGLRLEPWQLLSADPNGQARLAYTWPLPGVIAAMRWRPGDGMRVQAADINVWDTTPRQMLVVTRNILTNGRQATQANFANRPRTPARTLKQQLYSVSRLQRNYQKQLVTLSGAYQWNQTIAASSSAAVWSLIQMAGNDVLVRLRMRISIVSGTSPSIGVNLLGVDRTAALNGPWSVGPLNLDLTPFAVPSADGRIYALVMNKSAANSVNVDWQLFADVIR